MRVSVIIPALNEADRIESAIAAAQSQSESVEVVVVDGGSTDDTVSRAGRTATVVTAPRGRALQMNAGAECASGEILVFMHADSVLSVGGIRSAVRAVDAGAVGGTFRLQFDADHPLLRLYAFASRIPWHLLGFGDRGLFVRAPIFRRIGGFAPIPIFEDLDIVRRIAAEGRFVYLKEPVTTSARRFEGDGHLRRQLANLSLWSQYVIGRDPAKLARRYRYD